MKESEDKAKLSLVKGDRVEADETPMEALRSVDPPAEKSFSVSQEGVTTPVGVSPVMGPIPQFDDEVVSPPTNPTPPKKGREVDPQPGIVTFTDEEDEEVEAFKNDTPPPPIMRSIPYPSIKGLASDPGSTGSTLVPNNRRSEAELYSGEAAPPMMPNTEPPVRQRVERPSGKAGQLTVPGGNLTTKPGAMGAAPKEDPMSTPPGEIPPVVPMIGSSLPPTKKSVTSKSGDDGFLQEMRRKFISFPQRTWNWLGTGRMRWPRNILALLLLFGLAVLGLYLLNEEVKFQKAMTDINRQIEELEKQP